MPMKNSRLPDDFLARWVRDNPIHVAKTGNFVTCPVRLSWINVLQPGKPQQRDDGTTKEGNYNVQVWFPPGAEAGIHDILLPAYFAFVKKSALVAGELPELPENPFAATGSAPNWMQAYYHAMQLAGITAGGKIHQPFRDQNAQLKYGGTPGLPFLTLTTQNKPQVTDAAGNPIVDPNRIYPGVWAIVSMNLYELGYKPKRQPVHGVKFGLQSIMIVGDDESLGASAPPASDDFANVKISQTFSPDAAFTAPPGIMPPAAPVQAWTPPAAPPPATPAAAPGQWAPPPTLAPGVSNEQTLYGKPPTSMEDMF